MRDSTGMRRIYASYARIGKHFCVSRENPLFLQYRMKLRIIVDPDLCIGAASCVTIAPETFVLNVENKAEVIDHGIVPDTPTYERWVEVNDEEKANIILGAQSCPTLAIRILDEQGVQLYPSL